MHGMSLSTALTIAGSDPTGGAGLSLDLRCFEAHDIYGLSVVTALTAQSLGRVVRWWGMEPEMVAGQLAALLEEVTPCAIKVGMVGRADVVDVLVQGLSALDVPLVVDPVLAASGGEPLVEDGGESLEALLSHATLITPNLEELEKLGGVERWLKQGVAVLVKGGHGDSAILCDQLCLPGGKRWDFEHPRQEKSPHGTGCALSASITARLARGEDLVEATGQAITWLQARIAEAVPLSPSSVGWALLADQGGAQEG